MGNPLDNKSLAKSLIAEHGDMITSRMTLNSYWQELAENMYAQRATFTREFVDGEDYHAHQFENGPERNRRQLASTLGTLTHPKAELFFRTEFEDEAEAYETQFKDYLDKKDNTLLKLLNDPKAKLFRTLREADNDFVTFGNMCIFVQKAPISHRRKGALTRCIHLKNVHWGLDVYGDPDRVFRKTEMSLSEIVMQFGEDSLPQTLKSQWKNPESRSKSKKNEVIHCVIHREKFEGMGGAQLDGLNNDHEWVSLWLYGNGSHIFKSGGFYSNPYVIATWATTGGAYGYSPAATIALPASRELNILGQLFREGVEKTIDPPMITYATAGITDYNLYAGGMTVAELDFAARNQQAISPVFQPQGINVAQEAIRNGREELGADFFQNILALPDTRQMTAAEVRERTAQYIRDAGPILEPWESEYNTRLLERFDSIALHDGLYEEPPEELQEKDYSYRFDTPLRDAKGQLELAKAEQLVGYATQIAQFDQNVLAKTNWGEVMNSIHKAVDSPSAWIAKSEKEETNQLQGAIQDGSGLPGRAGAALGQTLASDDPTGGNGTRVDGIGPDEIAAALEAAQ